MQSANEYTSAAEFCQGISAPTPSAGAVVVPMHMLFGFAVIIKVFTL